jgi:hypothetical protein
MDDEQEIRSGSVCGVCGQSLGSPEELATHVEEAHGGLGGTEPGGTGGAGSETGSGPTGTTTSGSRTTGTAPAVDPTAVARDTDDAGGTTDQADAGYGRVQTE